MEVEEGRPGKEIPAHTYIGGSRLPGRGTRPRPSGASTRRTAFPLNSVAETHSKARRETSATSVADVHGLGPALIGAVGEAPLSPHSVGGRGRTPSLAPLIQGQARPNRPGTARRQPSYHTSDTETPRHCVCQSNNRMHKLLLFGTRPRMPRADYYLLSVEAR